MKIGEPAQLVGLAGEAGEGDLGPKTRAKEKKNGAGGIPRGVVGARERNS